MSPAPALATSVSPSVDTKNETKQIYIPWLVACCIACLSRSSVSIHSN